MLEWIKIPTSVLVGFLVDQHIITGGWTIVLTEVGDSDVVVVGDPKYNKYVWDASAVDRKWTD